MPRSRGRMGVADRVVSVPFKALHMTSIASGNSSAVTALTPAISARLASVAAAFEYYRFVKLRAEMAPVADMNAADTTDQPIFAVGYFPEIVTTTTTSITPSTVLQQLRSTYQFMQQYNASNGDVPGSTVYRSFSVPKSELLGTPLKWYPIVATSTETDVQQGSIIQATSAVVTSTTQFAVVVYTGMCEFRGFADSGVTLSHDVPPATGGGMADTSDDEKCQLVSARGDVSDAEMVTVVALPRNSRAGDARRRPGVRAP